MDRKILDKYFRDQCSEEELEQVLDWFQTEEGQIYLQEDMGRQNKRFAKSEDMFLYPPIKSDEIFRRIQLHKKRGSGRFSRAIPRVASILLIAILVSALLYWKGFTSFGNKDIEPAPITYATAAGQQKVFSLSDGTKIRLNEKSKMILAGKSNHGKRTVILKGEAYFEVTHDPVHPFQVDAMGAAIEDLGTKFNVKTDSVARNVQVAVMEGKVALKQKGEDGVEAFLTKNNFGVVHLSDSQITIEKANVKNYLSWVNGRLVFHGESLLQISRQLERLYDVSIHFETERLKELHLTANFEKAHLKQMLRIISHTLDIHYTKIKKQVIWKS